jgi:hypothetical protein
MGTFILFYLLMAFLCVSQHTTTGFGQMTENHINGFLWWKSIPREKFS